METAETSGVDNGASGSPSAPVQQEEVTTNANVSVANAWAADTMDLKSKTTEPGGSQASSIPRKQKEQQQQRHQPRSSASHSSQQQSSSHSSQKQHHNTPIKNDDSFQDYIANTAFEWLKFAGGVTWTATGALAAPPLHVTRALVTQLIAAVFENSPRRIQDWCKVVATTMAHLWSVLKDTGRGASVRRAFVEVLANAARVVTSDASRQVCIDTISCIVHAADMASTVETKAWLEQLAVTACRVVDLAASGHLKLLAHATSRLLWNACELLADPQTTIALAQVTAYMCHVLEMEHEHVYDDVVSREKGEKQQRLASNRRRERDGAQSETYTDRIVTGPAATAEEVILSSLGIDPAPPPQFENDGVPIVHVMVNEFPTNTVATVGDDDSSCAASSRSGKRLPKQSTEWTEQPRLDVDEAYLRDRIQARADFLELPTVAVDNRSKQRGENKNDARQHNDQAISSDDELDVEDLGVVRTVRDSSRPKREHIQLKVAPSKDDTGTTISGAKPVSSARMSTDRRKGEAPLDHFYRVLDEMVAQRRSDALQWAVSKENRDTDTRTPNEIKAAQARVVFGSRGGDDGPSARLRNLLPMLRGELEQAKSRKKSKPGPWAYALVVLLAGIVCSWTGLGCYGMYTLYYGQSSTPAMARSLLPHSPTSSAAPGTSGIEQEIVIRVVRVVVHTDKDGHALNKQGADIKKLSTTDIDKVTNCVATALQNDSTS